MQRKVSIPLSAPRTARREPDSFITPRWNETAGQQEARVLGRTRELLLCIRRGQRPEEIIDKGRALAEIKQLEPWRYDRTGSFRGWVKANLGHGPARAYHHIRIAEMVKQELVAGTSLCFEHLRVLSEAPVARHEELIRAAVGGASARALRLLMNGDGGRTAGPDVAERAARVQRMQHRTIRELHLLRQEISEAGERPGALLEKVAQGAARLREVTEAICSPGDPAAAAPTAPAQDGAEVDPRGSTSEPLSPEQPEVSPAEPPAAEEWYVPVARAVVEHLAGEEKPVLEDHLVMTLIGRPPCHLVQFVRAVSERMTGAPEALCDDVELWFSIAASLDIGRRWNDIYNFWVSAQLPGFIRHLDWLHAARLSEEQRAVLERAWAHWPLPRPGPPGPQAPPEEPGADGTEPGAQLPALALFVQEYQAFFDQPGEASAQIMAEAWREARVLKDSLEALEKTVLGLLEDHTGPPPG